MSNQPAETVSPAAPLSRRGRPLWVSLVGVLIVLGGGLLIAQALRGWLPFSGLTEQADLADAAEKDLERRNFRPLSGSLQTLLADAKYQPIPTQADPLLGQPAPDFTLVDLEGNPWQLSRQLQDGPVVLVFYYGYHCDHCVSQLFGLNKDIDRFRELGAKVVAVSADPVELTRDRCKKYGAFAFSVLSDPGNKVAQLYATYVPAKNPDEEGVQLHGTFVINRQGQVVWANRGDGPFTENRTLLLEIHRLRP